MARVLIVDDHPAVRLGLRAEVSRDSALTVVEGQDGETALQLVRELEPDAVLLGLSPAHGTGLAPIKQMVTACSRAGVIGLSTGESAIWAQAVIAAGARGCVSKSSPVSIVSDALHNVLAGQVYVDPAFGLTSCAQAGRRRAPSLSTRENDVLRLCALGLGRTQIAERLRLSPRTVETFKARAMGKLALSSRAELIRFAARSGWLDE